MAVLEKPPLSMSVASPPFPLRSKLPATGTSIFSVMSALAQAHGAVNLGQGFPDYAIDPALIDLVTAAMREGYNQYPLSAGVMALREAIAAKVLRLYGRSYDAEHEVTVTTGATQGLFTTIGALAHPGDEVILFEPAYDSYVPAIRLAGATPVPIPLTVPTYEIDWTAVRAAVTSRTRMILVNTPNNPGTGILSPGDLEQLAQVTRGTNIILVSDEVYEHMVYDGARHESLARNDELAARSVVIGSFGKTFHATGWKVGYTLAPRDITAEIRRVHQFTVFTVNSAVQHGLARFLGRAFAIRGTSCIFHCEARPPARRAFGDGIRPAAVPGQLFSACHLRPRQRRTRRGIRAAAGARTRGRDHSTFGVLPGWHRPSRDPVLLRQARRDTARCRGAAAPRQVRQLDANSRRPNGRVARARRSDTLPSHAPSCIHRCPFVPAAVPAAGRAGARDFAPRHAVRPIAGHRPCGAAGG